MKILACTLLLLMIPAIANGQLQKWGESGAFTKWYRYSYETGSSYRFRQTSPDINQFPELIDLARLQDPKPNVIDDREIAVSQLRTISRCKFGKYLCAGDDAEAEHEIAIKEWQGWWNRYGKGYAEKLAKNGKTYPKAWARLPGTKNVECPRYPILLPDSWSTTIKFRSGDYDGVTQEEITISTSNDSTSLTRKYTYGRPGRSDWQYEELRNFSHAEAQEMLAMLIYSVDNPWLYANDSLVVFEKVGKFRIGSIRDRPKTWSNYYPYVKWSGILDSERNVIINDDVWNWHTSDLKVGKTSFDETIGVAYRVALIVCPDSHPRPADSRWNAIDSPADK